MKYGVLVYKDTENIGDDIQSYCQLRFLPTIDYYVDREKLDTFVPNENEIITVIMNAWYKHNALTWPPSPFINPLFISVHFSQKVGLYGTRAEYLNGYGIEYLKDYKIGCRDESTMELLSCNGIDTYFSGCLTTTLKPFPDIEKGDYICLVDVNNAIYNKTRSMTKSEIKQLTHRVDPEINSKLSWEERFNNVEKLLKLYQGAKCVVTTRLHVMLPCLALGTPVLLLNYPEYNVNDRFSIYKSFVNNLTQEQFINGDYDINNPPPNPDKYLEINQKIEIEVEKFIEDSINKKNEPKIKKSDYEEIYIKRANSQQKIFKDYCIKVQETLLNEQTIINERNTNINNLNNVIDKKNIEIDKLNNIIKEKDDRLNEIQRKYDAIYYSRLWQLREKLKGKNR